MRYLKTLMLLLAVTLLAAPVAPQQEDGPGGRMFRARLTGVQEAPAILSVARGTFVAMINEDGSSVHYRLHYEGFAEGRTVTVAHIHVGQRNVAGGVTVFLCGGGGRPACTSPDGTFEDDFTAADVMAIGGQDLEAGDLPKLLRAMRAGLTYANVHTSMDGGGHPGGEIRGQIEPRRGRGESDQPSQSE